MKRFIVLFFLAGIFCGCGDKKETTTYPCVKRVFMHEPEQYSFLVQDGNILKTISFPKFGFSRFIIVTGIKDDAPMWAKVYKTSNSNGDYYWTEIHIHSEKDINGAGWNHGKFGSGQTVIVD